MPASKAGLVTLAVDGNVLVVAGRKLLDSSLDVLHATLLAHLLRAEVGVETSAVPVAGDGLGLERNLGAELLSNTSNYLLLIMAMRKGEDILTEVASNPQLVALLNTLAGADLELPLGGHDLGVGTGDLDTGVQAGLVVSEDDISHDNLAAANTAVVGALGSGIAIDGPAIRLVGEL